MTTDETRARFLERIAFGAVAITTRALSDVGLELTFAQWRALVVVGENEGGATVSEIGRRIGAGVSPTSRLVRRLATRGLVAIEKDAADRRVSRVRLTTEGATLRSSVLGRRRHYLVEVIAVAGLAAAADPTLEVLAHAFEKYV